MGACPAMTAVGRSVGRTRGNGLAGTHHSRVHSICTARPPVAASLPLGGALGRFPADCAYGVQGPAGSRFRVMGQVLRRLHPGTADVQPLARFISGGFRINAWRAECPRWTSHSPPRNPRRESHPPAGVFAFWAAKTNAAIMHEAFAAINCTATS